MPPTEGVPNPEAVPFNLEVSLRVLATPECENQIEEVVLQYFRDFIPDEAPHDPVHIADFTVGRAYPANVPNGSIVAPEIPSKEWRAVSIKMAMLHGLLMAVRNEIDTRFRFAQKSKMEHEGVRKMLNYWDLALEELARTRHQDKQELCWMMVHATCLIQKAFKVQDIVGPEHLRKMRTAFGLKPIEDDS